MQCKRGHDQQATMRVIVVIDDQWRIQQTELCSDCYDKLKPYIVILAVQPIKPDAQLVLSTEDWERILRRYELPTDMADRRILVSYERKGRVLFLGVYVAGAYWILFLDHEQLVPLDTVRDDAYMRACCAHMATFVGATLAE